MLPRQDAPEGKTVWVVIRERARLVLLCLGVCLVPRLHYSFLTFLSHAVNAGWRNSLSAWTSRSLPVTVKADMDVTNTDQ